MATMIAPELDDSLGWLNTPPMRLSALRGHPLVLLFWNAASAHGQNALQSLGALAQRHRGQVHAIAVHVPRFDFERDGESALAALRQSGVAVALVNDQDWVAWQHFELGAWPTAVVIDARGRVVARRVGDREVERVVEDLEPLLDAGFGDMPGVAEAPRLDAGGGSGALDGPRGLVASASRLFIADTGHHRILECTHDGRVVRRIGNGNRDFVDGLADAAGFRQPSGLALLQDRLYVADSGNHALRRINVRTGEVDTLVGNGRGGDPVAGVLANPGDSALDRPTALAAGDSTLWFTCASGHQVWAYELGRRELRRVSGSGRLGCVDGTADEAEFAQPVALQSLGDQLWVLDATSSALRQLKPADGGVRTVFGRELFAFGHRDGGLRQAQMQYPTALAPLPGGAGLWIADTGNGLLRRYQFRNQSLSTEALPQALKQPSALATWQNLLWIADGATGLVWRLDTDTGEMLRLPIEA